MTKNSTRVLALSTAAIGLPLLVLCLVFWREILSHQYLNRLKNDPDYVVEIAEAPEGSLARFALENFVQTTAGEEVLFEKFLDALDRLLLGTKLQVPEKSIRGFLSTTGVDIVSGSRVTIRLERPFGITMEIVYPGHDLGRFLRVNPEAKRKFDALYSLLSEDKPYRDPRYPGLTVTRAPDSEDSRASGRTTQQKVLILERLPHESSGTRR